MPEQPKKKKGGARKGAGRPKGSKSKPQILDYLNEKDIKTFIDFTMANYMEDSRLHTWLGDHIFGKAVQAVEMTGKDGEAIKIEDQAALKVTREYEEKLKRGL